MFSWAAFVLCVHHIAVIVAVTHQKDQQFSIDELLTTIFPKKISNDIGLNPCKADVFLDDIAINLKDTRKRYVSKDTEDDREKNTAMSVGATNIQGKKKIWKSVRDEHKIQKRASATTIKERLWDYGIIPYEIDETWSSSRKTLARQAMRHWENHTCLKFIEKNKSEDDDYVFFTEKDCGCCSFVGKRGIGAQALSIGDKCAKFGVIVHEIGHAIGYYHEHTRPDRDNYVQVFEHNIMEDQKNNFHKMDLDQVTSLGQKYDYDSIMHYARNTYAINQFLDTIQPIGIPQGKNLPEIGQRVALSPGDIQQTLKLYNCPKCGRTFQTKSGSFSSPSPNVNSAADEPASCEWRIMATPGEKVILNVTSMDIRKSPNCSSDYLEIRDGYWKKSRFLGRLCGSGELGGFRTETNRMLVTYVSENTRDFKGFSASFQVTCGGDLYVDSIGYLASPNYPDEYLPSKECVWQISVAEQFQVAIQFVSFDLEHHVDCSYDFVSIHSGFGEKSTHVSTFCGSFIPDHQVSTGNQMTVRFFSDKTNQKGGFSAKIFAEFNECEHIEHGCEQLCINTLGSFQCGCKSGFELHSDKRSCIDACGGTFKAPNGSLTSPSFPELYPPKKRCVWQIVAPPQYVIFLNFTHLDIEGNNYEDQPCEYDHVNVSSLLTTGKYKEHGSFCGTKKPGIIASESNGLMVSFGSDDNVQQTGFAAVYFMDLDECAIRNGGCEHECTNTLGSFQCSCRTGFTLDENRKSCIEGDCVHDVFTTDIPPEMGTISSPNFPKTYPPSKDCAWHLRTSPGHRIRLTFMIFNLESHPECHFDYLQVFDGDSSKAHQKGRYCGAGAPGAIDSTENRLYITFKSDANVHKKGFFAMYHTLCGGILQATHEKRQIYSHPSYGNTTYPAMRSCDWFLIGNDGFSVKLTFKEFHLEEGCYDFVEIFDGLHSEDFRSLGRFCGNETESELISTEKGMVVKFRSDDRDTGRGFLLEYELIESDYSTEQDSANYGPRDKSSH
ncbi:protein tolkin-like [Euwallacea similis]|uniref:protein tolkin-like n=1 Tax=Euwallacea similis TaxID=1736056 RepID=UPI00344D4959